MVKFDIVGQTISEKELYEYINALYEKSKKLTKSLESIERKKSKEIEIELNTLRKVLKKRV